MIRAALLAALLLSMLHSADECLPCMAEQEAEMLAMSEDFTDSGVGCVDDCLDAEPMNHSKE